MPFVTIAPPPGIHRSGTVYQAKGRWYDQSLMRFREDAVTPVGGWQKRSTAAAFTGLCRALLCWRDNSNNRYIAAGTSKKLYVQDEAGANHDITPIRRTATLGAGQVATTIGQTSVTITDNAHGASVGDFVVITGATAVGGVVAADLNTTQTLTAVTTNTITFTVAHAATSTTTGGGTPTLNYQITAGRADAAQNLGYGGGTYGTMSYGVPPPNTGAYLPATLWSLDTWGERLVACDDHDGKLYEWALNTSTPAAVISGAPTSCAGLVVTQEDFLFALAAGGDGRKVQWCDQENNTVWTPSATNQAGDFSLRTSGTLQCGKAVPGGALLFTDVDVWRAAYIGTPLVYGFERIGTGCGPISKGAVAAKDSIAAWMGRGAFWTYDGQSVQPLDCEARDWVFANLNANQRSKVTAVHLAAQGEVWWFFPSSASNENDSYIGWAYRESLRLGRNVWIIGSLARTAGASSGVFDNPLMVDPTGYLYEHETGLAYGGAVPFIKTGMIELGDGDFMMEVTRLIPDTTQDGYATATLYGSIWPDSPQIIYGPYALISPTDLLAQMRELQIRFDITPAVAPNIGPLRIEVIQGDAI